MEIIGLIPASGLAKRLSPLPFSKELYPLGFHPVGTNQEPRPKPVMQYLLDKYKHAGVKKVYVIIRKGKWDIPNYYGDGSLVDLNIAYLIMNQPYGVPFTLNQAYPFIQNKIITVGFPDILFQPEDAYDQLIKQLTASDTEVCLGLFIPKDKSKVDMALMDPDGNISEIQIKPKNTDLIYAWIIAAWKPAFTEYMNNFVKQKIGEFENRNKEIKAVSEIHLGHVVQDFIIKGNRVKSVLYKDGYFLDIGNLENLSEIDKT